MSINKKYRANTGISISATLPNGGNARISFTTLSDGTSVFYTKDPDLQWALEHHHRYGKMFRLESAEEEKAPKPKKPAPKNTKKETQKKETQKEKASEAEKPEEAPSEEAPELEEADENEEAGNEEPELKEVTVSDVDDAKDYLAEHFEVVRTKMKSEETINATARSFGIIFKYL